MTAALATATDAFALTEELAQIEEPGEVARRVHSLAEKAGFGFIIFGQLPVPDQRFDDFIVAKRVTEWFEIYTGKAYHRFDPVFRRLPNATMPYEYRVEHFSCDEPRVKELNSGRRDFGLTHGFMVPVYQARGTGFVWMSGETDDLSPRTRAELHLTALYAFDRIMGLVSSAPQRARRVTEREREVLAWIAAGKSSWEIGEILCIAKRTVDEHAKSAARKLGAVNRTQAVAIALRERVIDL